MNIPNEYRVVRSLGLGATSEVFEAVKSDTSEAVALKVFSPLILSDSDAVQRLRGEVEALEKLRHANIVSLRRTCTRDDFFALELELIDGTDLRQWAHHFDSNLFEPKIWMLVQIARGLGAAHENGVLHRDLKPENVLVSRGGEVKLTDFGLSRSISRLTLTRMGLLVGSLGYMAPECVNGLRATERSDLFSFGVIAYELLAGRAPFEAETPQALIKKITDGAFEPLKSVCPFLPSAVADEIDRCLAIHPDRRPESSWSVEAVLMNSLMNSGLLMHCKAMVSTLARDVELPLALAAKHEKLSERLNEALAEYEALGGEAPEEKRTEKRRLLLPIVNELKRVFPDDPLIARSLAIMTGAPAANSIARARIPMMVAAAIAGLALMILPFWQNHVFTSGQLDAAKSLHSEAALAPVPVAAPASAAAAPMIDENDSADENSAAEESIQPATYVKPKAHIAKHVESKKPAVGTIVFEADPDVDVYVDGRLVSATAWDNYEALAGERKIRLVKAGFDPIENTVSVKEGQRTVVRAKR